MDMKTNTIAGWALGAGGIALASAIVGGVVYHGGRPEKMGYPIEGVAEAGGGGEAAPVPIAALLPTADAAKGADVFKKCAACHTINQGGAAGVGPNLYAVLGDAVGQGRGFAFSSALSGIGGKWDFDKLNAWLTSPRKFADGTKMTFAGLSNAQDRANVILYLNQQGSNAPLPPPPAAGATAAAPGKPTDTKAAAGAIKAATTGSPTADLANHGTPASGAPSVDPQAAIKGAKSANPGDIPSVKAK